MTQEESDLPKLASPAQRALADAGITRLVQLTRMSEAEISQLHGIGPNAITTLRFALNEKGLSFLSKKKDRIMNIDKNQKTHKQHRGRKRDYGET